VELNHRCRFDGDNTVLQPVKARGCAAKSGTGVLPLDDANEAKGKVSESRVRCMITVALQPFIVLVPALLGSLQVFALLLL
jgi:hypothetical protein